MSSPVVEAISLSLTSYSDVVSGLSMSLMTCCLCELISGAYIVIRVGPVDRLHWQHIPTL